MHLLKSLFLTIAIYPATFLSLAAENPALFQMVVWGKDTRVAHRVRTLSSFEQCRGAVRKASQKLAAKGFKEYRKRHFDKPQGHLIFFMTNGSKEAHVNCIEVHPAGHEHYMDK